MRAVDLVEPLGLGIPGLEVAVVERPGGPDPVELFELAEILRTEPIQRCPVELGGPSHVVVHLWLKGLAVAVVPGVLGDVPSGDEDGIGAPVLHLAGKEVPPLEQQDLLAGGGEGMGQTPAPGAGPDDDHVVALSHVVLPPRSALASTFPLAECPTCRTTLRPARVGSRSSPCGTRWADMSSARWRSPAVCGRRARPDPACRPSRIRSSGPSTLTDIATHRCASAGPPRC